MDNQSVLLQLFHRGASISKLMATRRNLITKSKKMRFKTKTRSRLRRKPIILSLLIHQKNKASSRLTNSQTNLAYHSQTSKKVRRKKKDRRHLRSLLSLRWANHKHQISNHLLPTQRLLNFHSLDNPPQALTRRLQSSTSQNLHNQHSQRTSNSRSPALKEAHLNQRAKRKLSHPKKLSNLLFPSQAKSNHQPSLRARHNLSRPMPAHLSPQNLPLSPKIWP